MKLELGALALKTVQAVCAACLIGGGTMVLNTSRDNAVQDTQITELQDSREATKETMKELTHSVQDLTTNVAVLTERLRDSP